jgi:hypothetical protein
VAARRGKAQAATAKVTSADTKVRRIIQLYLQELTHRAAHVGGGATEYRRKDQLFGKFRGVRFRSRFFCALSIKLEFILSEWLDVIVNRTCLVQRPFPPCAPRSVNAALSG